MPATLTVPVTVTPDAAARVAELGHAEVFDRMVTEIPRLIPGLVRIEVVLVPDYDEGLYPSVMFMPLMDARVGIDNSGWNDWNRWKSSTFPPEVYQHYSFCPAPVAAGDG